MKQRQPEAILETTIVDALKACGWRVFKRKPHFDTGRKLTFGEKGHPDLEVLPGRGLAVFLEIKTAKGIVEPHQTAFMAELRARGYVVEVVRSHTEAVAAVRRAISILF